MMKETINRRQPFATEEYAKEMIRLIENSCQKIYSYFPSPAIHTNNKAIKASSLITNYCDMMLMIYTAGYRVESLTSNLEPLVAAYERKREFDILAYGSDEVCAGFGENDDYEQFLQTLSLCILLGRSELIPRLSAIFDRDNKGLDAIYETLLSFYDDSRVKTDDLLFKRPFAGLLKVIRATTPKEASKLLDKYCKDWYPAFKKAPWYDSHLSIDGEDGSYSGYWAFEAGAIAYLFNIDDSQIDHMVYPKDLVAYARSNTPKHNTPGPVHAGQPCPHTGYWFSPAQHNSRRHFTQGEIMPEFKDSPWGATIWYWSSAT